MQAAPRSSTTRQTVRATTAMPSRNDGLYLIGVSSVVGAIQAPGFASPDAGTASFRDALISVMSISDDTMYPFGLLAVDADRSPERLRTGAAVSAVDGIVVFVNLASISWASSTSRSPGTSGEHGRGRARIAADAIVPDQKERLAGPGPAAGQRDGCKASASLP